MEIKCILLFLAFTAAAKAEKPTEPTKPTPSDYLQTFAENFVFTYAYFPELTITYKNETMKKKYIPELEQVSDQIYKEYLTLNAVETTDADMQNALKQAKNFGFPLKLGKHLFEFGENMAKMKELLSEKCIENYEDADVMYAIRELPEVSRKLEDLEELEYYWEMMYARREGQDLYKAVEALQNIAKRYNTTASQFLYKYDTKELEKMDAVMQQLQPFYQQLHAYVRHKFVQKYGQSVIPPKGPIPAHLYEQLISNIWTEASILESDFEAANLASWSLMPQGKFSDDKQSAALAKKFYQSLGLTDLPSGMWEQFLTQVQPLKIWAGRIGELSAKHYLQYDLSDDFGEQLVSLAQLYAIMLSQALPFHFWEGYALETAVGNVVKLSAMTERHFNATALLYRRTFKKDEMLNANIRRAISDMFSLVNAYVGIKTLTSLLDGAFPPAELNAHYWHNMDQYAGVEPPANRTGKALDIPYAYFTDIYGHSNAIHKFSNIILSYQFYSGICKLTGHTDILQNCDFYGDENVGTAIKKMLALGSSKPFETVVAPLLGENAKLNADALLDYFKPTQNWLRKQIKNDKISVGWEKSKKELSLVLNESEAEANLFLLEANMTLTDVNNKLADDLLQKDKTEISKLQEKLKSIVSKAKSFDVTSFKNSTLRRAINGILMKVNNDLLDLELLGVNSEAMSSVVNDELKRPYMPDIERIFKNATTSAKDLKYYLETWRNTNAEYGKTLLHQILNALKRAAQVQGSISPLELWLQPLPTSTVDDMQEVIEQLMPFYNRLHEFTREQLVKKKGYSEHFSSSDAAIPEHLLEQVLQNIWTNESIAEEYFAYQKLPHFDPYLRAQNYDKHKLLQTAADFYESLGFVGLDKTTDETAGSYKVEEIKFEELLRAHRYMGQKYYAHEKQQLPLYFRDTYNLEPSLDTAIALSIATEQHAKQLFGYDNTQNLQNATLNYQLRMAIQNIFQLHKSFVQVKLVAEYLEGKLEEHNMNRRYWELMVRHAGIEPSRDLTKDNFDFPHDFYHNIVHNKFMVQFSSLIFGHQFYEAFCELTGHEGAPSSCDFYKSKAVGEKIREILRSSSSKGMKTLLKIALPKAKMSGKSLLRYFAPLKDWLYEITDDDGFYNYSQRKFFEVEDFSVAD